jgi:transcriptional regulator with XRE-family HTH domain
MARKERSRERAVLGLRPYREEGDRLKGFRKALLPHLSFSAYAEDAQLTAHGYRQNENGKTRISTDNALLLKRIYGISLDWIYDGDKSALSYAQSKAIECWLRAYRKGK